MVLVGLLLAAFTFHSCKEDIDLANVDPQIQLDMGLALPLGTVETTLDYFLGTSDFGPDVLTYSPLDSMLILHYDTSVVWDFHNIDLSEYTTWDEQVSYVVDGISNGEIDKTDFDYQEQIPFPATQTTLEFLNEVSLENFNVDLDYEEIDSVHMTLASFRLRVDVENFDLEWSEVSNVRVKFTDPSLRFDDGTMEKILPIEGKGFGQDITVSLYDFMIIPQKNQETGSFENIRFFICIDVNTRTEKMLSKNSMVKFGCGFDFLDYDVLFGVFEPKKAAYEHQRDTMSKYFAIDRLDGINLPFSDPKVDLVVSTSTVGLPSRIIIDSIYVENGEGERGLLSYDGETTKSYDVPYITSPWVNQTASTDVLHLGKGEEYGNLDHLFQVIPKYFGYSYRIRVDRDLLDELKDRHTPFIKANANYQMNLKAELPLKFYPGVNVTYKDTVQTTMAESLKLDSLLSGVAMLDSLKTGELFLRLVIENNIPFDIKVKLRFLNDYDEVVPIGGLYDGGQNDSIMFSAMENNVPTQQAVNIDLDEEDVRAFENVTQIIYDFYLGDNTQEAAFYASSGFKLHVGLAGKVEAIINLGKENKQ